jgi:hypothetical protein
MRNEEAQVIELQEYTNSILREMDATSNRVRKVLRLVA